MTDYPREFPTVRYWQDGRQQLVRDAAEYATLAPGHADNPGGPFEVSAPEAVPAALSAAEDVAVWRAVHARREQGYTQQEIATVLGMPRHRVRRYLEMAPPPSATAEERP